VPEQVSHLIEALEASDVSAINGIVALANILHRRGLLSAAEASAMYQSMSLPLGLARHAENSAVQDLQANLDRLFAVVVAPD
jgi:beta-phosphoglucomutase-like phosphatase (HAD superfamily)